jgi:pimeloyl-ACP methyl ester carboxylesterase
MRQKKSAILVSYFFFAALFFQVDGFAQRIAESSYPYPYKAPYLASTTVVLMQGSENPPASEIKDLRVDVLKDRNDVYLLEGMGALRYRFYRQHGKAPLVFLLPGIAGSAYSGSANFLAEWLASSGFHALILPSRFNWNFTLAASTSGYPGYTQKDTQDLYAVMQLVLNDIKTHCNAQVGKIGVLGLSDGALHAGYISKIDSEQKQIGIDSYLLVNPPVNLLETAKKIGRMTAMGKEYSTTQKDYLESYAFGIYSEATHNDIHSPDYFANWDKRLQLTDKQIKYLIGKAINDEIGDAIYAIELINRSATLKTPVNWENRSGRLYEARSYGLMNYVKTFLVPGLRRSDNPEINLETLDKKTSIKSIKSALENNPTVFLMHNLDDILVSAEEIAYLEKIFGKRATIYPHGGHLGNLWYSTNKKHILEVFIPLLEK